MFLNILNVHSVPPKLQNLQKLVGQIHSHSIELEKANFNEFLKFGQIAYGIGQLLHSEM